MYSQLFIYVYTYSICIFNSIYIWIKIWGLRPHPCQRNGRSQPFHPLTAGMSPGFDVVCLATGYEWCTIHEEGAKVELETGDEHSRLEWCEKTSLVLGWANIFSTLYMLLPCFRGEPFAKSLQLMHHSLKDDPVRLMYHFSAVYLLKTIKKD